jgi:hypothetical protein
VRLGSLGRVVRAVQLGSGLNVESYCVEEN